MTQPDRVAGKDHRDPAGFVRANTEPQAPRLLPELSLHLASELMPLWHSTEEELAEQGVPPPYWAFAWAGGQALARFVLDNPDWVRGRRVLDFAAGCGLVGIAAAKAGAQSVVASELDPFACAAVGMNAATNGVRVEVERGDVIGRDGSWDAVLAGDVCYEEPMAGRVADWLWGLAAHGTPVMLGDPGRAYLRRQGLTRLACYTVWTTRELEDNELRWTSVWRVDG